MSRFYAVVWRAGWLLRQHVAPAVSDAGWAISSWADARIWDTEGAPRLTADQARTYAHHIIERVRGDR